MTGLGRVETWPSVAPTIDTEREALQLIESHLAEMPALADPPDTNTD